MAAKRIFGSGLTARAIPEWSDDDVWRGEIADAANLPALQAYLLRHPKPSAAMTKFDRQTEHIVMWAREVLKGAARSRVIAAQTVENYAAACLLYVDRVRYFISSGNADQAAIFGELLGEKIAEARIKFAHEETWLRGLAFRAPKRRRRSRLYREAEEVLSACGANLSAKRVRRELESRGIVQKKPKALVWKDDNGKTQRTAMKQFETNLSRLRKTI